MEDVSGWYILKDWNLEDFDRNSIITNLHVKYGVSPFFRVSVQRNPRVPDAYSITISPSGLGLPDRYYYYTDQNDPIQGAYKQLIRDVVILFSQFTRTNAQKFGEDMFSYEKRIAEITPHIYESINPVNTYNPIKLSELKITVSSLPLLDILSAMYPECNISEETEVIVTSIHYLTEVSHIASTTDKATLNSYLIWTLVREYLPYLSNEFTSTLNLFNGEVYGYQRALPRWEKCVNLVRDVMGLAIEAGMESKHPITNISLGVTSRMFDEIKKSVEQRLLKLHISSPLHKYLSNKLSRLQIQIGLPSVTRNASYVKDYYSKLMILKASLFDSIKNSLFFKRRAEERLLTGSRPYDNIISHTINNPTRISYIASSNTILVPRSVLTAPQFESDFPSSILYGRLGVEIAEAVTSSVLPFDSQWTADFKLLSPFHLTVNESYEAIGSTRSCILDFIENNNLAPKFSSELTISTLKHLFAVSVAHQALNAALRDSVHLHQPSLEKLEESNLFFLSYAESQCSILTKEQDLYDNVVKYALSKKSLLKTAWQLLPEFNDVFDCSARHGERCGDMF
ncbi:hypothetical protein PPYR_09998 [Photinus pyralis]|uniref:Peptidase M13 N-terminal domain-containing protein n=1 Tax=Photinus pyralis TaxID=7054 RepID=A0A5N4AF28_PHOPY|nr:hypothetical protein PPYR_09998 [Photinus pyralis]